MTATSTVSRRFATLVPGMYPAAPRRNLAVAVTYLYAVGVTVAVWHLIG